MLPLNEIAFLIALSLASQQFCVADCPDGWLNVLNEKCVKHFRHRYVTWADAQETCEIHGGDLLMILSREERRFLL